MFCKVYIGPSTQRTLAAHYIETIDQLAQHPTDYPERRLASRVLYTTGLDTTPVKLAEMSIPV